MALLLGVTLVATSGTAAMAATTATPDVSAIDQVLATSPTSESVASLDAQAAAVDGNVVTVGSGDSPVAVTVPVSEQPNVAIEEGLVSLADDSSYSIVPTVIEDGSVAIHSVLNSAEAPRAFDYILGLQAGAVVQVDEASGSATALNADGSVAVMVAAPWATDANGRSIPTHYSVSGHTLTQHVEVTAESAFPVVADPWLGVELVAAYSFNFVSGSGWRLNVDPTLWARGYTGHPTWVAVGAAGWDEVSNKMSSTQVASNSVVYGSAGGVSL